MTSTDGDKELIICKCDLNIIEAALHLTQGYTKEFATESVKRALHIIKDVRDKNEPITEDTWDPDVHGYCGDGERATARIKEVIAELERRKATTRLPAGEPWIPLSEAISLLKGEVGK